MPTKQGLFFAIVRLTSALNDSLATSLCVYSRLCPRLLPTTTLRLRGQYPGAGVEVEYERRDAALIMYKRQKC